MYLPGLDGPLLLDDRHNLAPLAQVGDGTLSAWQFLAGAGEGAVFRPVSRASFLLDWWLWGDDVRAFKSVNLALHLLCGLLVFALARALLEARGDASRGAVAAALLVCGAWLLAPLLVSTVLYTVQRMAQLAALFCLAGLLCYVQGRRRGSWRWIACAFVVFWPLAGSSKENGALLPLLALIAECWCLPADRMARPARRLLLVLVAVPSALALGRVLLDPQWLLAGYAGRDFTLGQRLLTEPRVLLDYLGNLLLLPGASPFGVFRDGVAPSTGLVAPPTTGPALLGVGLLAAAALAARGTALAPAGFGIAFFLAAHALESTVFPLELQFEHRNYLPAFGVYFALGALGRHVAAGSPVRRPAATLTGALAALLVLIFAALTWQRAQVWRSEATLYAHAAHAHPRSARAHLGLASVHFSAGRFAEGTASLERAARLLGPGAQVAIALQSLAAHCLSARPVPDALYRRIASAPGPGVDHHTLNALAWTAGAVGANACPGLDHARLTAALAQLELAPAPWDPAAERLRGVHLSRLLDALRRSRSRHEGGVPQP